MRSSSTQTARPAWAIFELGVTLLLAPWFVFLELDVSPWLLLVFPALWFLRWLVVGQLTVRTQVDPAMAVILVMVAVGVFATYDRDLSFPKTASVLYGIVLTYVMVNTLSYSGRLLWVGVGGVILLSAVLMAASFHGMAWGNAAKIPLLQPWIQPLQTRLDAGRLGGLRGDGGFNANQVAGTFVMVLPMIASLGLASLHSDKRSSTRAIVRIAFTLLMLSLLFVGGLLLLLSQSRSGIIAVTVSLLSLIACQGRVGLWVLVPVLLGSVLITLVVGPQRVSQAFFAIDAGSAEITLQGRLEIWHRSWRVLRDHALTGIGFETLVPIIHTRYPTYYISPDNNFNHAHNQLLQVGLELGVPGLVAYLALLMGYGWGLVSVVRRARSRWLKALALGLLLNMAGAMVFGIADTIELGEESALLFWLNLGLGLTVMQIIPYERGSGSLSASD